jgi:hypothetical protein
VHFHETISSIPIDLPYNTLSRDEARHALQLVKNRIALLARLDNFQTFNYASVRRYAPASRIEQGLVKFDARPVNRDDLTAEVLGVWLLPEEFPCHRADLVRLSLGQNRGSGLLRLLIDTLRFANTRTIMDDFSNRANHCNRMI